MAFLQASLYKLSYSSLLLSSKLLSALLYRNPRYNTVSAANLPGYVCAVRTRRMHVMYLKPFDTDAARDLMRAFSREGDALGDFRDVGMG